MTLTLIIGLPELTLLHGKVITWRPVKNCSETRLNVELNDYARLVALRLNQLFDPHNIVNPFAVDTLHELCENNSPLLSQFLTYVDTGKEFDFNLLKSSKCVRVNILCVEPVSSFLGFVFTASLIDKVENITIEIYSDYWNRILDVLQFLKFIAKNVNTVVFSNVFDYSCYYIFDDIYIKQNVLLPGTDKLANEVKIVTIKNGIFEGYKSIKNFSLVKEFEMFKLKTTSQHVDDDVLHLLSVLASMAGFASLQTLQQQGIDPETIVKAEKMGCVKVISISGVDQVRMTLMGWQVYSKFKEK